MNLQIYFRVDSSSTIGTGHVIRSLVLADFLKQHSKSDSVFINFISSDFQGNINNKIKNKYKVFELKKNKHQDNLKVPFDWETDCYQTTQIIKNKNIDLLIVDNYRLDYRWESCIKNYTRKLMVIDDLFRIHNCHLLLDQNINASNQYYKKVPKTAKQLLGTKYILLNKQFTALKRKNHNGCINRIHICFGGSDINNITGKIIQFIINNNNQINNYNNLLFDVVVGGSNPNYDNIKKIIHEKDNFNIFRDVDNMAELLFNSDLAIGASGTSAYERCFIGIPSIVITIADNQILMAGMLQELNTSIYLGHQMWDATDFINTINKYINNKKFVIQHSKNCKKIVDGYGVTRINNIINDLIFEH